MGRTSPNLTLCVYYKGLFASEKGSPRRKIFLKKARRLLARDHEDAYFDKGCKFSLGSPAETPKPGGVPKPYVFGHKDL